MNPLTSNTIGIRELHAQMKKVSARVLKGQEFIVMKNARPIFKIVPYQKKSKKFVLGDLLSLKKSTKDSKLSLNIDRILYA